ncbi:MULTISPECIES: hypothetical protein [unclassified Amycolatopsis]|uniref:hypothetical protein n=1 Tax=unclassified Amycolatopsis TaxID=2618356 RepID=UPI00344AAB6B
MSGSLNISVRKLQAVFGLLISRISEDEGETISIDPDYFWSIPLDSLYDPEVKPDDLTIGQLSESWQYLEEVLVDQDLAVPHHLVWLAEILRALGDPATRPSGG